DLFGSAFAPWAVLLHETGAGAGGRTVGAPAPGANGGGLGGCGLTPLSHRGRCSYINQSRRRTPDGTRPGCEGGGLGGWGLTPLRTGAVLLHETPAGAVRGRVGAPAPGAMGAGAVVVVCLRFRSVGGALAGNPRWRRRPDGRSTRPGCECRRARFTGSGIAPTAFPGGG